MMKKVSYNPIFRFFSGLIFLILLMALTSSGHGQYEHRMNDITIEVQDGSGNPVESALIDVDMLNHEFRWGCAVNIFKLVPDPFNPRIYGGNEPAYDSKVVTELQNYFNSVSVENRLKWGNFENYTYNWYSGQDVLLTAINEIYSLNAFNGPDSMRFRGHVTVWSSYWSLPSDVRDSTDGAFLLERINNHITQFHQYFAGIVTEYDMFNEPFSERDLVEAILPDGVQGDSDELDLYANWYIRAAQADPDALFYINEYNILNDWSGSDTRVLQYKAVIDGIRDRGGQLGGIGLQAHIDHEVSQSVMTRRLNILAAPMAPTTAHPDGLPGLPLQITELDINEDNDYQQNWYGSDPGPSEAVQAELVQNVIRAAFAHPSVTGVTIWVMNDSEHWRRNAVLFDDSDPDNWTIKPSGQVFIDHVKNQWWTDETGFSDNLGGLTVSAYKGLHAVSVSVGDWSKTVQVQLSDDPVALTIKPEPELAVSFSDWQHEILWTAGSQQDGDSNPDQDNLNNYLEYATGSNPLRPDSTPACFCLPGAGGGIDLFFRIRNMAPDLSVILERSGDLNNWEDLGELSRDDPIEVNNNYSLNKVTLVPSGTSIFYRLRYLEETTEP